MKLNTLSVVLGMVMFMAGISYSQTKDYELDFDIDTTIPHADVLARLAARGCTTNSTPTKLDMTCNVTDATYAKMVAVEYEVAAISNKDFPHTSHVIVTLAYAYGSGGWDAWSDAALAANREDLTAMILSISRQFVEGVDP